MRRYSKIVRVTDYGQRCSVKEYAALQDKAERRKRSVINKYGATSPAEFFRGGDRGIF